MNDFLFDQPARQLGDALDLVGDRAELLVEDDPVELLRLLLERNLQVLLPEEARIGEARGEDPAIAFDDRLAAVAGADVGDADEGWRESPSSSRQAKYFWLVRMVSTITSRGTSRNSGVEAAEQKHRPFGEPGILDHQPLIGSNVSPASAAAFSAPSRMIRSRSSWSTMTWQARSFST